MKKLFKPLVYVILFATLHLYPMNFATRGIYALSKAVSIGLPAVAAFKGTQGLLQQYKQHGERIETLPQNNEAQARYAEILSSCKLDHVRFKNDTPDSPAKSSAAFKDIIVISNRTAKSKTDAGTDWILLHELGHIYYGDTKLTRKILSMISSALVIQLTSSALAFFLKTRAPSTLGGALLTLALSIPKGSIKIMAAHLLQSLYQQYKEGRADRFACNQFISTNIHSAQELHTLANRFDNHCKQMVADYIRKSEDPPIADTYNEVTSKFPSTKKYIDWLILLHLGDAHHPHLLTRMRLIRETAARIEAQKQNNTMNNMSKQL